MCVFACVSVFVVAGVCMRVCSYVRAVLARGKGLSFAIPCTRTHTLSVSLSLTNIHTNQHVPKQTGRLTDYGVATISRMLKKICLFAEYRSLL